MSRLKSNWLRFSIVFCPARSLIIWFLLLNKLEVRNIAHMLQFELYLLFNEIYFYYLFKFN